MLKDAAASQELLARSNQLSEACVVPDYVSAGALGLADVAAMLHALAALPEVGPLLRVFVDGRQCFGSEKRVLENPPTPDESLEAWGRRLFGDSRWGCTLYRAEQLCDAATRKIVALCDELVPAEGPSPAGREVFVFIGDYGQTPFGIHKDEDQDATVHLHIGPSAKRMYLWSPEVYREQNGDTRRSHDLERLEAFAQEHLITAGAAFVLPADVFHVGETLGVCAGVAVSWVKPTPRRLVDMAMSRVLDRIEVSADEPASASLLEATFDEALGWGRAMQEASLRSNAWMRTPPRPMQRSVELEASVEVQGGGAFPIQAVERDATTHLFIRGHSLELPTSEALSTLVARINRAEVMSIETICTVLEQDFDADAARFLCSEFLRCHGLQVVEASA